MKAQVDDIQKQSAGKNEAKRDFVHEETILTDLSSLHSNRGEGAELGAGGCQLSLSLSLGRAGTGGAAQGSRERPSGPASLNLLLVREGAARGLGCGRHVGGELESGAVSSSSPPPGVTHRAPWLHPGWLAGPGWPSKAWPEGLVHRLSGPYLPDLSGSGDGREFATVGWPCEATSQLA